MSPYKLSLFNNDDDNDRDEVELDDELVGQLRETVEATPDLTMEQAVREGLKSVVEKRRPGGGQQ